MMNWVYLVGAAYLGWIIYHRTRNARFERINKAARPALEQKPATIEQLINVEKNRSYDQRSKFTLLDTPEKVNAILAKQYWRGIVIAALLIIMGLAIPIAYYWKIQHLKNWVQFQSYFIWAGIVFLIFGLVKLFQKH